MRTLHSHVRLSELVLVWHKCKSRAACGQNVGSQGSQDREGGWTAHLCSHIPETEQVVHFI